jgi:hypothetical protein
MPTAHTLGQSIGGGLARGARLRKAGDTSTRSGRCSMLVSNGGLKTAMIAASTPPTTATKTLYAFMTRTEPTAKAEERYPGLERRRCLDS